MAVALGIHICQTSNCKVLKFSETTGAYNAITNPGGWATGPYNAVTNPNPQTSNVNTGSLVIVNPSNVTSTITFAQLSAAGFPTDDSSIELDLFNGVSTIGVTGPSASAFPDGMYSFTYNLSGSYGPGPIDFDYTVTQSVLLTCQTRCCIDKMFHLASQSDCTDCKNEKLNNALEAEAFLKSAEYAAACGKIEMAKKNLAKAQWICNTKNCLNC
jgi:hypothetical protein